MIHYILQVIAFQLLFLVVYDVFLKKETFFTANRLYLLGTSVVSFVLPFLKFEAIQQTIPQQFRVQLPEVILGNPTATVPQDSAIILNEIVLQHDSFSWSQALVWLYGFGVVAAIALFGVKLWKLYRLKKMASIKKFESYSLASVPKSSVAFTFFKTIYLGAAISEEKKQHILQHELVHVKQNHTLDLLFFEVLRIAFWFNPMVYVFQKKMQALHEYVADRSVATTNKIGYYQNLLSEVFGTTNISFINTFYKSSILKNRIVMLQKSNSRKIVQLKYLLLIPVVSVMLFYTSCTEDSKPEETEMLTKIENLQAEISNKGNLSEEEFNALLKLVSESRKNVVFENENTDPNYLLEDDESEALTDVPFAVIQQPPTFPGCEGNNVVVKECMSQKIQEFVSKNFNVKLANELNLSGKQRIALQFKIDKTGNVVDTRARAAHPDLAAEAMRVVSKLPKMIPGEQDGKKVSVLYSLPIVFEIDE
jgi:hypothetical protein